MNNSVLTIILLLVMMVVVMTSLNRSSGSSAFGSVSSILLVLTLIFIIHFLIKNVLKTRGNQVPEEDIEAFLGKCSKKADDEEISEKENFEMKNDLLEYVQNMGESRNTEVDITMKQPVNIVQANSPSDKLASYGSHGTTDLNSFFNVQRKEACVFKEVPTGTRVQTEMVKTPELVDKVSNETLYLSNRNDNMVKAKTVENTNWQYDNEKVMNGGELFNGVSGYNDMDSGYASVL